MSFCYFSGLLSEEQCKARDARRKAKQRYTQNVHEGSSEKKPALNPECSNSNSGEGIETKAQSPPEVKFASTLSPYAIIDSRPIQSVCEDTRKLIEKLVKLQDKFEFPEESKVNNAIVSINMHFRVFQHQLVNYSCFSHCFCAYNHGLVMEKACTESCFDS